MAAERFDGILVTDASLQEMIGGQSGEPVGIPDQAWRPLAMSVLATLALDHPHLVVCVTGAELLVADLPSVFRVHLIAPESERVASLMADGGLSRTDATRRMHKMRVCQTDVRKRRFGQKTPPATAFDMILNARAMPPGEMLEVLTAAVRSRGLLEAEPLSATTAAKVQFHARLHLARRGLGKYAASQGHVRAEHKSFGHPSEEVFANLLDLYRIAWAYEPRSFPLQWDKDGKVSEAFTPDFYLPEFDLYVELTTMKQANVTKKNRKIRLLRAIYPHVNIQIFYQKDVRELVMKYRLPDRLIP